MNWLCRHAYALAALAALTWAACSGPISCSGTEPVVESVSPGVGRCLRAADLPPNPTPSVSLAFTFKDGIGLEFDSNRDGNWMAVTPGNISGMVGDLAVAQLIDMVVFQQVDHETDQFERNLTPSTEFDVAWVDSDPAVLQINPLVTLGVDRYVIVLDVSRIRIASGEDPGVLPIDFDVIDTPLPGGVGVFQVSDSFPVDNPACDDASWVATHQDIYITFSYPLCHEPLATITPDTGVTVNQTTVSGTGTPNEERYSSEVLLDVGECYTVAVEGQDSISLNLGGTQDIYARFLDGGRYEFKFKTSPGRIDSPSHREVLDLSASLYQITGFVTESVVSADLRLKLIKGADALIVPMGGATNPFGVGPLAPTSTPAGNRQTFAVTVSTAEFPSLPSKIQLEVFDSVTWRLADEIEIVGCGNGVTDLALGESCDDGNSLNGDGCTASCQHEFLVTTGSVPSNLDFSSGTVVGHPAYKQVNGTSITNAKMVEVGLDGFIYILTTSNPPLLYQIDPATSRATGTPFQVKLGETAITTITDWTVDFLDPASFYVNVRTSPYWIGRLNLETGEVVALPNSHGLSTSLYSIGMHPGGTLYGYKSNTGDLYRVATNGPSAGLATLVVANWDGGFSGATTDRLTFTSDGRAWLWDDSTADIFRGSLSALNGIAEAQFAGSFQDSLAVFRSNTCGVPGQPPDIDIGEACDDGNRVSGDGCSADCQKLEVPGDGILDVGEECDDPALNASGACMPDGTCNKNDNVICGDEQCWNGPRCANLSQEGCFAAQCMGIGDGTCRARSGDSCDASGRSELMFKSTASDVLSFSTSQGALTTEFLRTALKDPAGNALASASSVDLVSEAPDGNLYVIDSVSGMGPHTLYRYNAESLELETCGQFSTLNVAGVIPDWTFGRDGDGAFAILLGLETQNNPPASIFTSYLYRINLGTLPASVPSDCAFNAITATPFPHPLGTQHLPNIALHPNGRLYGMIDNNSAGTFFDGALVLINASGPLAGIAIPLVPGWGSDMTASGGSRLEFTADGRAWLKSGSTLYRSDGELLPPQATVAINLTGTGIMIGLRYPSDCGDEVVDEDESCDTVTPAPGQECSGDCLTAQVRNDGFVNPGEQCDDSGSPSGECDDAGLCLHDDSLLCMEEQCSARLECANGIPCTLDTHCAGIEDGLCLPRHPAQCADLSVCVTDANCLGIEDGQCSARDGDGCDQLGVGEIMVLTSFGTPWPNIIYSASPTTGKAWPHLAINSAEIPSIDKIVYSMDGRLFAYDYVGVSPERGILYEIDQDTGEVLGSADICQDDPCTAFASQLLELVTDFNNPNRLLVNSSNRLSYLDMSSMPSGSLVLRHYPQVYFASGGSISRISMSPQAPYRILGAANHVGTSAYDLYEIDPATGATTTSRLSPMFTDWCPSAIIQLGFQFSLDGTAWFADATNRKIYWKPSPVDGSPVATSAPIAVTDTVGGLGPSFSSIALRVPRPDCGNGVRQAAEQCDDGNVTDCDGCSAQCLFEIGCGDGTVCGAEVCDDGNNFACDGCAIDCSRLENVCGDGVADTACGEGCDDFSNDGGEGECLPGCDHAQICGDGVAEGTEVCDDIPDPEECYVDPDNYPWCTGYTGAPVNCDGCSSDCQVPEFGCGDGQVCGEEACDDGLLNGSPGNCSATCSSIAAICGDGMASGPEECDDGNNGNGDGCSHDCLCEGAGPDLFSRCFAAGQGGQCGDGLVNSILEDCDDGNFVDTDSCPDSCLLPLSLSEIEFGPREIFPHLASGPSGTFLAFTASAGARGFLRIYDETCGDPFVADTFGTGLFPACATVREIALSVSAGQRSVIGWDGKATSGQDVPDGAYILTLDLERWDGTHPLHFPTHYNIPSTVYSANTITSTFDVQGTVECYNASTCSSYSPPRNNFIGLRHGLFNGEYQAQVFLNYNGQWFPIVGQRAHVSIRSGFTQGCCGQSTMNQDTYCSFRMLRDASPITNATSHVDCMHTRPELYPGYGSPSSPFWWSGTERTPPIADPHRVYLGADSMYFFTFADALAFNAVVVRHVPVVANAAVATISQPGGKTLTSLKADPYRITLHRNEVTNFIFSIGQEADIAIRVDGPYNSAESFRTTTLPLGRKPSGNHEIWWDARCSSFAASGGAVDPISICPGTGDSGVHLALGATGLYAFTVLATDPESLQVGSETGYVTVKP